MIDFHDGFLWISLISHWNFNGNAWNSNENQQIKGKTIQKYNSKYNSKYNLRKKSNKYFIKIQNEIDLIASYLLAVRNSMYWANINGVLKRLNPYQADIDQNLNLVNQILIHKQSLRWIRKEKLKIPGIFYKTQPSTITKTKPQIKIKLSNENILRVFQIDLFLIFFLPVDFCIFFLRSNMYL